MNSNRLPYFAFCTFNAFRPAFTRLAIAPQSLPVITANSCSWTASKTSANGLKYAVPANSFVANEMRLLILATVRYNNTPNGSEKLTAIRTIFERTLDLVIFSLARKPSLAVRLSTLSGLPWGI